MSGCFIELIQLSDLSDLRGKLWMGIRHLDQAMTRKPKKAKESQRKPNPNIKAQA
jgi:hypothetical protein